MPNDQTPVDMQTAGGMAPPPDAQSLVGMLRSGGSPPAGLMEAMRPPTMTPATMFASAVTGGLNPGAPNPMVQQQNEQQRMQMQQAQLIEKVQARRQQEAMQRDQYLDGLTDILIKSNDPDARLVGWTNKAKRMQQFGIQLPPTVLQSLSRGDLSMDSLEKATLYLGAGIDEAMLPRLVKGIGADQMPFIKRLAESDDMRKKMGLRTKQEDAEKQTAIELQKRKADLEDQKAALAERKADIAERRMASAEDRAQRNEARADRRLDLMEKSLLQRVGTKEQKQQQTFAVMEDALNLMAAEAERLDAKHYLPKTAAGAIGGLVTGDSSAAQAKLNQTMFGNDEDWRAWKNLQASMIGFDRAILNDIGARAMAAWRNQFAFFDNPPTKKAIDQSITQMRRMLQDAKDGKAPDVERVTIKVGTKYYEKDYRRGDPLPPGAEIIKAE